MCIIQVWNDEYFFSADLVFKWALGEGYCVLYERGIQNIGVCTIKSASLNSYIKGVTAFEEMTFA